MAGVAAVGSLVLLGGDGDTVVAPTIAPSTTTVSPPTTVVASTLPPERLVEVNEVWLLDRGEGEFDWGLTVSVPPGAPSRSGVLVSARLVAADGAVIEAIERTVDGVNERGSTAVAGRLSDSDDVPSRLEFDITVGVPSDDDGLDDVLSVRALERRDDELVGRIRSVAPTDIEDFAVVLVWREPSDAETTGEPGDERGGAIDVANGEGAIVDVVVYEVDRLRVGVDAQFAIDLAEQRAPDGLPDDVLWSPQG